MSEVYYCNYLSKFYNEKFEHTVRYEFTLFFGFHCSDLLFIIFFFGNRK